MKKHTVIVVYNIQIHTYYTSLSIPLTMKKFHKFTYNMTAIVKFIFICVLCIALRGGVEHNYNDSSSVSMVENETFEKKKN